jgi:LuxR family maltose regulon positive regulatory protein
MDPALLATKLQIPRLRPERISRPRLLRRLDAGLARPLTLISAPAGFGKTTLVAEWLAGCPRPFAWLSLEEQDSDPARFLTYLVAALQTIEDEAGQQTLAALAAAGPRASLPMVMPLLVSEIEALPEEIVLVLDDYHLIDAQAVHEALTYLVEHMPQRMHLSLVTRADPPLPLARLRARGHLNELRQADLRFTPEETASLLEQALRGALSKGQIEALNERTEGWIAGLQMAVLALQELPAQTGLPPTATDDFIRAFSGTQRHILDYLVEEVLSRQPPDVQSFLLQTSILDRLCGSLCDAVTKLGAPTHGTSRVSISGQRMLEDLERTNLFVTPLDDRREWYRYHRLFADLLRQRLQAGAGPIGAPDITMLHCRAATWFASEGMLPEAIRHALDAADYEGAAGMIERAAPFAWKQGELATLQQWMEALPEEVLPRHPLLCIYTATVALLRTTSLDRVEPLLRLAAENDREGRLHGEVQLLRALVAMFQGDLTAGLGAAQEAVRRLAEGSVFRGLAMRTLSALHLLAGETAAAERLLEQDLALSEAAGDRLGHSASLRRLGSLALYGGELVKARALYQRALELSRDASGHLWPMAGRVLTHLGELALEQNQLEEAEGFINRAVELLDQFVPGWNSGTYLLLARLRHALHDEAGSRQALQTARERARGTATSMDDVYMEAQAARLALMTHDMASAERWALAQVPTMASTGHPQAQDIETLVRSRIFSEMVQMTLARLSLARGEPGEALSALDRLEETSSTGDMGNRVEFLVLRALAESAAGQAEAAARDIGHALRLAEPEGFVRTFIDEGEPIAPLLREAARRGVAQEYAGRLIAALEESARPGPAVSAGATLALPWARRLAEPLTEREVEVLRLLRTSMTTPEIAAELGIAPSTVRTFVKHLYGKLGVHRRLDAIDRAVELGILKT